MPSRWLHCLCPQMACFSSMHTTCIFPCIACLCSHRLMLTLCIRTHSVYTCLADHISVLLPALAVCLAPHITMPFSCLISRPCSTLQLSTDRDDSFPARPADACQWVCRAADEQSQQKLTPVKVVRRGRPPNSSRPKPPPDPTGESHKGDGRPVRGIGPSVRGARQRKPKRLSPSPVSPL